MKIGRTVWTVWPAIVFGAIAMSVSMNAAGAEPGDSAATTAPTSAPAPIPLADGAITFTPPAGWPQVGAVHGGKAVGFALPNVGQMVVNVDKQEISLAGDNNAAAKIGQMVVKQINDNVARSKGETKILDAPKIEKDDRFFLRVHSRWQRGEQVGDQLQIYRAVGKNLVAVAVTAFTDSPEKAKEVFALAEQVLLSVNAGGVAAHGAAGESSMAGATTKPSARPAGPAKTVALPKAKLRIVVPAGLGDWQAEQNDADAGIVMTFRPPESPKNFELIALTVRALPKEARTDPKLRDALMEELANGEQQQLKIDGAQVQGSPEIIRDNRFLRKSKTRYDAKGHPIQLISRQLRAGDEMISVVAVCAAEDATTIDKLADDLALGVRAMAR